MKSIRGLRFRSVIIAGAILVLVIAVACSVPFLKRLVSPVTDITDRVFIWFEDIRPAGKLVVLTARQRHELSREFSARLLALINLKASVGISVIADTAYYIEVSDPQACRISWDRRSRTLRMRLPAPHVLPPAILTETLEVTTKGANILTESIFRLKEAAKKLESGLSEELKQKAEACMSDPEIAEKINSAVATLAERFFFADFQIKPEKVIIDFDDR